LKIAVPIPEKQTTERQRFLNLFNCSSWLSHFFYGVIAFVIFEFFLGTLLKTLGLSRDRGFFFTEFMIFASVSGVIYFYSRSCPTEGRRQNSPQEVLQLPNQGKLPSNDSDAFSTLDKLSEGIADSLSAIMFYARTNLVHEENSQKIRDLREIMERIDQVQLLIQNMAALLTGVPQKQASRVSADEQAFIPKQLEIPKDGTTGQVCGTLNRDTARPYSFLRKSARKVLILPTTVRIIKNEKNMEFETYTINVCEEGACIIFADNVLADKAVIDVQIAAHFESRARIKWIQLSHESSFRLAGIEFLESKLPVA
jgi:hypothetical protein